MEKGDSAAKKVHLTEEWIRERLHLERDKLDNVKALLLPGTYHEKIVSIGKSLERFTRLKELDLSRNSIIHLYGLENLQILETLNLYYNQVENVEDLKLLRNNKCLKKLDLRLNPVSKHVADYRQLLIEYLPHLEKLDDRPIKDAERMESSERTANLIGQSPHVQSANQFNANVVPAIKNQAEVCVYGNQELRGVVSMEADCSKYQRPPMPMKEYQDIHLTSDQEKKTSPRTLKNSMATFTPNPNALEGSNPFLVTASNGYSDYKEKKFCVDVARNSRTISKQFKDSEDQFCLQIINLAEQFWEGSNTLQERPKFLSMIKSTFRDYTRSFSTENKRIITQQQETIQNLTLEASQLNEKMRELKANEESQVATLRAKVNQLEDQLRYEQSQRSAVEKTKRRADEELIELKHKFNEYQLMSKCKNLSERTQMNSEVTQFRSELDQFHRLNDTVASLKDNQVVLMRTNEQLSRELGQLRTQQMFSLMRDPNLSLSQSVIQP